MDDGDLDERMAGNGNDLDQLFERMDDFNNPFVEALFDRVDPSDLTTNPHWRMMVNANPDLNLIRQMFNEMKTKPWAGEPMSFQTFMSDVKRVASTDMDLDDDLMWALIIKSAANIDFSREGPAMERISWSDGSLSGNDFPLLNEVPYFHDDVNGNSSMRSVIAYEVFQSIIPDILVAYHANLAVGACARLDVLAHDPRLEAASDSSAPPRAFRPRTRTDRMPDRWDDERNDDEWTDAAMNRPFGTDEFPMLVSFFDVRDVMSTMAMMRGVKAAYNKRQEDTLWSTFVYLQNPLVRRSVNRVLALCDVMIQGQFGVRLTKYRLAERRGRRPLNQWVVKPSEVLAVWHKINPCSKCGRLRTTSKAVARLGDVPSNPGPGDLVTSYLVPAGGDPILSWRRSARENDLTIFMYEDYVREYDRLAKSRTNDEKLNELNLHNVGKFLRMVETRFKDNRAKWMSVLLNFQEHTWRLRGRMGIIHRDETQKLVEKLSS